MKIGKFAKISLGIVLVIILTVFLWIGHEKYEEHTATYCVTDADCTLDSYEYKNCCNVCGGKYPVNIQTHEKRLFWREENCKDSAIVFDKYNYTNVPGKYSNCFLAFSVMCGADRRNDAYCENNVCKGRENIQKANDERVERVNSATTLNCTEPNPSWSCRAENFTQSMPAPIILEKKQLCENTGGRWILGHAFYWYNKNIFYCDFKYKDAGKPCLDSTECEGGLCLADFNLTYQKYLVHMNNSQRGDFALFYEEKYYGACSEYPERDCNEDYFKITDPGRIWAHGIDVIYYCR